jgi:hypothetical protein
MERLGNINNQIQNICNFRGSNCEKFLSEVMKNNIREVLLNLSGMPGFEFQKLYISCSLFPMTIHFNYLHCPGVTLYWKFDDKENGYIGFFFMKNNFIVTSNISKLITELSKIFTKLLTY